MCTSIDLEIISVSCHMQGFPCVCILCHWIYCSGFSCTVEKVLGLADLSFNSFQNLPFFKKTVEGNGDIIINLHKQMLKILLITENPMPIRNVLYDKIIF